MKKIMFFLLFLLPVLAFGQSGKPEIIKKVLNTEVQRVSKNGNIYVRFITHYQEDVSECIPTRPDCDLYRTQKLSYKEYLFKNKTGDTLSDKELLESYLSNYDSVILDAKKIDVFLLKGICVAKVRFLSFKDAKIIFGERILFDSMNKKDRLFILLAIFFLIIHYIMRIRNFHKYNLANKYFHLIFMLLIIIHLLVVIPSQDLLGLVKWKLYLIPSILIALSVADLFAYMDGEMVSFDFKKKKQATIICFLLSIFSLGVYLIHS